MSDIMAAQPSHTPDQPPMPGDRERYISQQHPTKYPPPQYPPSWYPPQGQCGHPKSPSFVSLVTVANKWRLGLAAGCQLLGLILVLCIPTTTSNQPGIYYITSSTNGEGLEIWGAVSLIASAVLVGISVYRFVRPVPVKS